MFYFSVSAGFWLVAEAEKKSLLQRLDPAVRAKVLAALAALVMLGLLMMVLAWLGGRFTRKYINRRPDIREPDTTPVPHQDDWASKPLSDDPS